MYYTAVQVKLSFSAVILNSPYDGNILYSNSRHNVPVVCLLYSSKRLGLGHSELRA
jgi:hypothetical protein